MARGGGVVYTPPMRDDSGLSSLTGLRFRKMHGLGNDFVVLDLRGTDMRVTGSLARRIGDRHRGIGFDQLVVIGDGRDADADIAFWNADGSEAQACGNGLRCAARLLMDERGTDRIALRTGRGLLHAESAGDGMTRVNMGPPQTDWAEVPLARAMDLDVLPLDGAPGAVGMGNPHCVFFVPDAEAVDLSTFGPRIEHDPLFPERTNVEVVEVIDRQTLRMRIWERGGIVTQACGSGACAAVVVAARRGLLEREAEVRLDGGALTIDWREDGVWMTGPTAQVFSGEIAPDLLAGPQ